MLTEQEWRRNVLISLVVVAVLLVVVGFFALRTHFYLGNSHGTDPRNWKGLVGNIAENNKYLRETLKTMGCSLWHLQNPDSNQECPPGPPTESPTKPPNYPP